MSQAIKFKVKQSVTTTPSQSAPSLAVFDALPDSGWLRESQLVRSPKSPESAIAPLLFSAPTLWRKVKAGTFPKPYKLSERVTAWKVSQVREWMAAHAA